MADLFGPDDEEGALVDQQPYRGRSDDDAASRKGTLVVGPLRYLFYQMMAEFIGTAGLVYMIASATALSLPVVIVALVSGFAAYAMTFMTVRISGGFLNPALATMYLFLRFASGRFTFGSFVRYVVVVGAELAGALLGAWLAILSVDPAPAIGAVPLSTVSDGQAVLIEAILVTFLCLVFFTHERSSKNNPTHASFRSLSVGAFYLVATGVSASTTGASLNPWRYLSTAIIADAYPLPGIYIGAPFLGCIVAAIVHYLLGAHMIIAVHDRVKKP